jgi:SAM-dependent methyltransferase
VEYPGKSEVENTNPLGKFLRDVMRNNLQNFRVFGPDETASNRLNAIYEVSKKTWMGDFLPEDLDGSELATDGRVMEILSEHTLEGWLEGYLLTGRHGFFHTYEAFAENMPFADNSFDLVHTSAALHEMNPEQLQQILNEVYRVLKPGGIFTLVDFHSPTNPIFWPGVAMFLWLFETETAWQLLETDLVQLLSQIGFNVNLPKLYAGGSLQVIHGVKPE